MLKSFVLIILLSSVVSQKTLAVSDPSNTRTTIPTGFSVVVQNFQTTNHPNFLGNSAQWIWLNGPGQTATFQTLFYSTCPQKSVNLIISADDTYTSYINGDPIGSGTTYTIGNYYISLQCGLNNLTTQVVNLGGPAGLIFVITQNQTNCYQCGSSAYYDFDNCKCICESSCEYQYPIKMWAGYPTCGCKCFNQASTVCDPKTQYFNERTCACQCQPVLCAVNLEQDPQSCMCRCKQQPCEKGKVWSYSRCGCVKKQCPLIIRCSKPQIWDDGSCSCQCPQSKQDCSDKQRWSKYSCVCKDF